MLIPTGAVVEVKLKQNGSGKITGKLGPVTEEGFEVQAAKAGKVSSEKVAFADVKSVGEKHGTGRVVKILIVTAVVLGAVVVVLVIVAGKTSG